MDTIEKGNCWRELYKDAILEHDPEILGSRIFMAQKAIHERARKLWYEGAQETIERERLSSATRYLEILHHFAEKKGG